MLRRFSLVVLALVLLATFAGWRWWRAGEELRRSLEPPAQPTQQHAARDCASLPRQRLMVVLVLGQSNSANHVQSPAVGGPGVHSWHEGRCYEARDPLPGASGEGGSLWTRLGPSLLAARGVDNVLFVPLGITSTSVAQWAHHPALVQRLVGTVRSLQAAGLSVTDVLWYQGEADSFKNTPAADYRRDFALVAGRLRELGIQAPIYVALATLCQKRSNPAVRAAQQALVTELPGVRSGPDMDALFSAEHRYDGCHFSTASASLAADAWRRVLLADTPKAGS